MAQDLESLQAYQAAKELKRAAYELAKGLPGDHRMPLRRQLESAAASVSANIAEGYGRFNFQERIQFFFVARASCLELADHLDTLAVAGHATEAAVSAALEQARQVARLINGYVAYLRIQKGTGRTK